MEGNLQTKFARKQQSYSSSPWKKLKEIFRTTKTGALPSPAGNVDPVLGQTIAETEEQNEELQNNVMTVSRALLKELGTFSKNMSTHRQQLQEVMQKTTNL
ncbi:hypothetical protein GN956_G4164 [Arapaima gigas]